MNNILLRPWEMGHISQSCVSLYRKNDITERLFPGEVQCLFLEVIAVEDWSDVLTNPVID